jgi:hypothetical protein
MSSLAAATTVVDDTIDDAINETKTSTSGNDRSSRRSRRLTKDPNPTEGGGAMPEDAIPEGGKNAFPRGGADDDDAVVASDDLK